jgi:hypothetical protein
MVRKKVNRLARRALPKAYAKIDANTTRSAECKTRD